ncbi:mitochondrial carrier domain-containing protein [Zychaea mexicana]|uniref:mitochondrial carrier domain-containing protein n=1 Tax=Zychaea mexicana TaxID=64656 RepID=UPI0022FE743D|nr:mitochondrial carrier domain-containing protein [Zychaea mexicana]KAI9496456.1 mitochondrial carrier domain-containing protein [Zychaea mexicana]
MATKEAPALSEHYRQLFYKHASVEKDNERYMTQDDFLAAIAPGEDFKKIQREQYGLLYKVADKSNKGLVSFQDFVIFENLLSKPDAEYEIAFRLFDVDGTGKITFDQFKDGLSSNMPKDAVAFDFDCDWLKLYIGKKEGHHELSYEEFSQLLKGLQGERLRQEFKHYDTQQSGYIEPEQFQRIILDIAKHKLSDHVIDHLPTLCNLYAGSGNKITFSNVVAFHNVIRNIDMVEAVIKRAIDESPTKKITKADFLNHAAQASRYTVFTPMEADVIFHFAGVDGASGTLGLEDFGKILDPRWTHPEPEPAVPVAVAGASSKKKSSLMFEIMENAYAFVLGSIAGAVGATAVYPIDLVKTRMQNQRSKVVGELLYKNSFDCFKKVIKNEGFAGLYRGLGPQLVGVAPEKAIKLTVNDFVRNKLTNKETGEIKFYHEMIAGGAAGGSQVVFTNPLEIVKIRLQIQGEQAKNSGVPRRSAIWIVKHLGIVGLYKGASACLLRDVPFSAIYFPAYAHLKRDMFHEGPNHKLTISELLMAGAIAGMPAAYFTTPADVIKTRLQVEARSGQTTYTGIADAASKIFKEEGFKAFFKGGPARIFRSSPQFGVTLTVYEILHQAFPLPGSHASTTTTTASSSSSSGPVPDQEKGFGPLRSRNALKMLLDLDYRFGVYKAPQQQQQQQQQQQPASKA